MAGQTLNDSDYKILVNYINGIYYANLAFSHLVDYFENVDEPTIVVMYGDHIPAFSENTLKLMGLDGDDFATRQRLYSVPIIMWSNLSNEYPNFSGESIYYLPQILLEYADMPDSDMRRILRYERRFFKADSRSYILSPDNTELSLLDDGQFNALKNYKNIEYDLILGNLVGTNVWQPIR